MKSARIRDAEDHITQAAVEQSATNVVRSGSVLLVTRSGILKHSLPVAVTDTSVAINQDIKALEPTQGVSPEFVAWALRRYEDQILHGCTKAGTTVQSVEFPKLLEFLIPLAPAHEQAGIVNAIEEQFSRLDAGVQSLQRARRGLVGLRNSMLLAAFTGRIGPREPSEEAAEVTLKRISEERRATWEASGGNGTYAEPAEASSAVDLRIPPHWALASLEALTHPVRVICYGILMPKEHLDDGVPYVRVRDIRDEAINLTGLKRTSPEIAFKYRRASLQAGDVVLAIRGTYGRAAIVPGELQGGNITQDTARLALHPEVDSRYILYYLSSPFAKKYLDRVARGVAVKGVNIADVRAMPVPIAPIGEQQRVITTLDDAMSLIRSLFSTLDSSEARGRTLRREVLRTAFKGGLVPPDPGEAPVAFSLAASASSGKNAIRTPPSD
jgi:type I restriction enzyme S subunit